MKEQKFIIGDKTSNTDKNLIGDNGENVELEDKYVYPLLKSSDIANKRTEPRKYVIVTQKRVGDDTSEIKSKASKTWAYLEQHAEKLDSRICHGK